MRRSVVFRGLSMALCFVLGGNGIALAACVGSAIPAATFGPAADEFHAGAVIAPNDAWAVGMVSAGSGSSTSILVEHWNGAQWMVVPTPSPPLSYGVGDVLNGIAAIATDDVWAVGVGGETFGGQATLTEHWDGVAWTIVPSPASGFFSTLNSVSAVSSTDVWAAGYSQDFSGVHALVEHWNGAAWTVTPDPNNIALTSISALSPTDVWATGKDVEHWDGTTWSVVSKLSASSISAVAPNDVWILDGQIEHWNGSVWKVTAAPLADHLVSIAANGPFNAWAVGSSNGQLTEHWDGAAWTIVPSPAHGTSSTLSAVGLNGSGAIAVGSSSHGQFGEHGGLAQIWNGSRWRLKDAVLIDTMPNSFSAIFASAPNDAWSVGRRSVPFSFGLTEHWDGLRWNHVQSSSKVDSLDDVTGLSANDIWAIGSGDDRCGTGQAIAEHWDGVQWTFSSPDVCADAGSVLNSVAEATPTDLWAVGSDSEPGARGRVVTHDLVVRRTGRRWTTYSLPDDPYSGGLSAAAAASTNDVWAVGNAVHDFSGSYNLIYHWDGTAWTDVRVYNPQRFGYLLALGVVSSNDVWAVGGQAGSLQGASQPLIDHWDGSVWSVIPHAPGANGAVLRSVRAISADDVWAAGADPSGTHIEHWNGSKWSVIRSSSLPGGFAGLAVVPGTNSIWAVGSYPSPYLNAIALSAAFHC